MTFSKNKFRFFFFENFRYPSVNWTNFAISLWKNSPILRYHKIEKGSLSYNQCFPFSFVVSKVWRFFQIFSIFFSNLHFFKKRKICKCFLSPSDEILPPKKSLVTIHCF